MVQFKVLIRLIVVIISLKSLNSCVGNNHKKNIEADTSIQMKTNDTLFLSTKDYKIILSNDNTLDIEVTNNQLISLIKNEKYPIIKIEIQEGEKIAKGNNLLCSFVPENCDYFYPLNKEYVFFVGNRINFKKILNRP